jgi:hypothetical protein
VLQGERVLFLRRWLGVEGGEGPSPIQAAGWLDIKRSYMALRPGLRRVYATVRDLATFAPIVSRLRFRALEGAEVELDGVTYHSALRHQVGQPTVDRRGPEVEEELGLDDYLAVDTEAGEFLIHGRRITLTPLELGLIAQLHGREGEVVSRRSLLREVWGSDYEGGSNLVDSVVRSLRKKLADDASSIETVRGFGYRFRRT